MHYRQYRCFPLFATLLLSFILFSRPSQTKADDQCPTVTLTGNPGPCHVTPGDPGELNGSVVSYTVTGNAHGNHADGTPRKITVIDLYTVKSPTQPSVGKPSPGSPGNNWTLKWSQSAPQPLLTQYAYTWNVMYFGAGQFWWLGASTDDFESIPNLYFSSVLGPYSTI